MELLADIMKQMGYSQEVEQEEQEKQEEQLDFIRLMEVFDE